MIECRFAQRLSRMHREIAEVHVCSWKVGYRGLLPQDLLDSLDPRQRVPRWEATLEQSSWPDGATLVAQEADHVARRWCRQGIHHGRDTDSRPAKPARPVLTASQPV
jgi:hypothetical protein